ncbi:MAG: class I SAM-dependent methyltransferase [Prolixibacteraceae bacterium]|jgi:ubiquinone/menaquinone biosynthesis C-methylase UbiE|nr:class I SAM-dependent methyltransferase [Prolixibacteraceae bacterium]
MDVRQAYNIWAEQYDTNNNKTRDLEAYALRDNLAHVHFDTCLEIGCGTGKNTEWLLTKSKEILAVDLSEEMLSHSKAKIDSVRVQFHQADINKPWTFVTKKFHLVTFSLVLEHIENLDPVLEQAANSVLPCGYLYIGELHPFKQYAGTKARFETEEGIQIVTCFNHNVSDFTDAGKKFGFEVANLKEYFDENDRTVLPRILTILLKKNEP